jgi:hypothetical protein
MGMGMGTGTGMGTVEMTEITTTTKAGMEVEEFSAVLPVT